MVIGGGGEGLEKMLIKRVKMGFLMSIQMYTKITSFTVEFTLKLGY